MSEAYFRSFENASVSELTEHPRNQALYPPMDQVIWELFLQDIAENGITTPVKYNQKNNQVIAGNQRLRAARALGLKTVPALGVWLETEEEELIELIRDNDIRRRDTLVARLRRVLEFTQLVKSLRTSGRIAIRGKTKEYVKSALGASSDLYNAAIAFQLLNDQQKTEILEYAEYESPSEAELKKEIGRVSDAYAHLEAETCSARAQYEELSQEVEARYGVRFDPDEKKLIGVATGETETLESVSERSSVSPTELKNDIEWLEKRRKQAEIEARLAWSQRDTALAERKGLHAAMGVLRKVDSRLQDLRTQIDSLEWDTRVKMELAEQVRRQLIEFERIADLVRERMLPQDSEAVKK